MGVDYIEYRAGTWQQRRLATRAGLVGAVVVLLIATGTIRLLFHAVVFFWFVVTAIAVVLGGNSWAQDRPVCVRLTSKGVEQYFTRSKYIYVPWRDVATVGVDSERSGGNKIEYPVLVLKDGTKVRVSAVANPIPGSLPPATYFGAVPRDPRFEEKVSEMRRLLAESEDLVWSDEPSAPRPDQDVQPGATNPDS
ncbi:MAG TPA: hypothetical protein VGM10_01950 [Actinocrinis sp.]|jgi:hypothetical protein